MADRNIKFKKEKEKKNQPETAENIPHQAK